MTVQGLRDTSGFTVTGQRPKNWREGTMLLYPNGMTPLTGLTSLMREESSDDPEFNWFEKIMADQRVALDTTINASETTMSCASGATQLKIGHLIYSEHSGEIMRVTSPAPTVDTAFEVVRGYSGTTAALITVGTHNPNLLVIGSAYEEGSSKPAGVAYDPTQQYNYTQIWRNTLEMTETARRTRLRTGDQVREAKREALQYHNIEMERAFFFGERWSGTLNSKPVKTTEGFFGFMARRASARVVTAASNQVTFAWLEAQMKEIFNYGSTEKIAFLGNQAALVIQQAVRLATSVQYVLQQGQKEFGMNVSRLISPFGELVLKTHPLFNRITSDPSGSPSFYSVDSWVAVMDMENIRYRYLTSRDTKFEGDQEVPGDDQMVGGYLTEAGIEWRFPESHYVMKGFGTAAAG